MGRTFPNINDCNPIDGCAAMLGNHCAKQTRSMKHRTNFHYLTCVHHDMWFHFIVDFFESGLKNFVSIRSLSHLLSLTQIEERNVVFTSGDMDLETPCAMGSEGTPHSKGGPFFKVISDSKNTCMTVYG